MHRSFRLASRSVLALFCVVNLSFPARAKEPRPVSAKRFHTAADDALAAMRTQADTLHIQGVAVVAFAPGASVQGWMSQMEVVGHLTDDNGEKGNNLLGIAYAKAAEMANTLQNSGTSGKPPLTGEFGWQGGVVAKVPGGYLIVSFSGGRSGGAGAASKATLAVLQGRL